MYSSGGTLSIYWWGCAAAHTKGVSYAWVQLNKGGLRYGHRSKKKDRMHGHESIKGVLRSGLKKDNLSK